MTDYWQASGAQNYTVTVATKEDIARLHTRCAELGRDVRVLWWLVFVTFVSALAVSFAIATAVTG